jgi:GntR family transcriptional regulator of arabinose operon
MVDLRAPSPLYLQIVDYVKNAIADGTFAVGRSVPPEAMLAQQLSVSRETVRRAYALLAGDGVLVKIPGRGTFVQAASRPGLTGNPDGGQSLIGIVVHELRSRFSGMLLSRAIRIAEQAGYVVMVSESENSSDREADLLDRLNAAGARGLIVMPADDDFRRPEMVQRLTVGSPVPVVALGQVPGGLVSSVTSDNEHGTLLATRFLFASGRRRIGFVSRPNMWIPPVFERFSGYSRGLAEQNLAVETSLVVTGLSWVHEEDVTLHPPAVERDLTVLQAFLADQMPRGLDGIIAVNDVIALEVAEAADRIDVHVPDDLAIVGFDNIPLLASLRPGIASVEQPLEQMGEEAVQVLLSLMETPGQVITRCLPVRLVTADDRADAGALAREEESVQVVESHSLDTAEGVSHRRRPTRRR